MVQARMYRSANRSLFLLRKGKFCLVLALFLLMAMPVCAEQLSGVARYRAWSGWWWPKHVGELVIGYDRGRPSPVDKYDLYTNGSYPGSAALKAAREWYDPEAEHWVGFCHGWVNASILEPEPTVASSIDGIFMRVGDKKGLLTACHAEDEQLNSYCKGNPAEFHRYLLEYIGEKGQPVGADLDSSEEFWSYPIYAYEMDIATGQGVDRVSCTIHYANDFVSPDFVGTDELTHTYTYELDKDREGNYTGSGRWTGDSAGDRHPEWVWVPVGIQQENLFLDYQKVVEMVTRKDDYPVDGRLKPGHDLLTLDPGQSCVLQYRPHSSEKMVLSLALDKQTSYGNQARYILEKDGVETGGGDLSEVLEKIELQDPEGQAYFRLKIFADSENLRPLGVHLLVDVDSRYTQWFYGLEKFPAWVGLGVGFTPGSPTSGRAWLEIVDEDGIPVGNGGISDSNLAGGGGWFQVLGNRITQDYNFGSGTPVAVKLVSEYEAQGLLLSGDENRLWGGGSYLQERDQLVVPWLTSSFDMSSQVEFYLHNRGAEPVSAALAYFRRDGRPGYAGAEIFSAGKINSYDPGAYPGQGGIDGWALITRAQSLSGSVVLNEGSNIRDSLPLLGVASKWLIPHLALVAGWQTILGICNPKNEDLELTLTAYSGEQVIGQPCQFLVPAKTRKESSLRGALFGVSDEALGDCWVAILGQGDYAGYIKYRYLNKAQASIPLVDYTPAPAARSLVPLAVSGGWWTGVVLLNSTAEVQNARLSLRDVGGELLASRAVELGSHEHLVASLTGLFPNVDPGRIALLQLEDGSGVKALAIYGAYYGTNQLTAKCW